MRLDLASTAVKSAQEVMEVPDIDFHSSTLSIGIDIRSVDFHEQHIFLGIFIHLKTNK
jgi:hypothetical protein